jgi:acetyl esterase/lipase
VLAPVLAALASAGCTPLTTFDTLVPKDTGVEKPVRDVAYGSDPRQRIDVYRPRRPAGRLPIIVFLYGGSWNSGTKNGYAFVGRALAAQGFLVAIPDYRLVPKVRYPTFVDDGAAAVRWVADHAAELGGDPEAIVIAGHSAGAYIGAMLAYDARWLGADRQRVSGFIGLAGPYDFAPFRDPVCKATFRGVADVRSTQPVSFVRPGAPPAFLATAVEDRTVLPRNSDSLALRVNSVGSWSVRRSYPKIGHVGILTAIARPLRGRASVLEDMTEFARQVTRTDGAAVSRAQAG